MLLPLAVSLFLGTALCELISSGGFYFFSGRFEQTNLTQFASRLVEYFPRSFSSLLFYVGIAGVIHALFRAASALAARTERFRTSS